MISKTMLVVLRVALAVLLLGSLFVQTVMVPMVAYHTDDLVLADRRTGVLVIIVLGILTTQVVMVCVWRLLTMVHRTTIFSFAALPFVHAIAVSIGAAAGLLWLLGFLAAPGEEVAPGMVLLIGGAGAALAAVALLVWVLRTVLLHAVERDFEAIRLRTELDKLTAA